MDVVFHIGAHLTNGDRLVKSLLKNLDLFSHAGVAVPGPGRYRRVFGEAVASLRGQRASTETVDALLEIMLDGRRAERLILSNESFISMASRVIEDGQLYARAHKAAWLSNTLPVARPILALAIRNPATFLPALFKLGASDAPDFASFLGGLNPAGPVWSDYIERLQGTLPGTEIIVWCDEDTPLLWPDIIRALADFPQDAPVEGGLGLAARVLTRAGYSELSDFLAAHPAANAESWRETVAAFLDRYTHADALEVEVDVPGWDADSVEMITDAYDADTQRIAAMTGVRYLSL